MNEDIKCPEDRDPSDDCKHCIYGEDYHLVGDECLLRTFDPDAQIYGGAEEVHK